MSHEININLECNEGAAMNEFDTFLIEMHYALWCHRKDCIKCCYGHCLITPEIIVRLAGLLRVPVVFEVYSYCPWILAFGLRILTISAFQWMRCRVPSEPEIVEQGGWTCSSIFTILLTVTKKVICNTYTMHVPFWWVLHV
jgi:hypothetical protein